MSDMRCCDEVCNTPFCPMCGKPVLPQSHIQSLLKYCREMKSQAFKDFDRWVKAERYILQKGETPSDKRTKMQNQRKERLVRWSNWVEALETLINNKVSHER